jgi:hypothetical protein
MMQTICFKHRSATCTTEEPIHASPLRCSWQAAGTPQAGCHHQGSQRLQADHRKACAAHKSRAWCKHRVRSGSMEHMRQLSGITVWHVLPAQYQVSR